MSPTASGSEIPSVLSHAVGTLSRIRQLRPGGDITTKGTKYTKVREEKTTLFFPNFVSLRALRGESERAHLERRRKLSTLI